MAGGDEKPLRKRDRFKAGMKRLTTVPLSVRTSDLPKRAASAMVMLAVAGAALWFGGWFLDAFIALIALATAWEFLRLVKRIGGPLAWRIVGMAAGLGYIGFAAWTLGEFPASKVAICVGIVVCVDTFAYFSGRTFGGPKIAPRISPSKTWAGLFGGALGATIFLAVAMQWDRLSCAWLQERGPEFVTVGAHQFGFIEPFCSYWTAEFSDYGLIALIGFVFASVAQAGDFLESWLKRKAGVKDSSNLIPGHGGVFDRVDGVIAVAFAVGVLGFVLT
ncbi:phosphatidate cytidylyltransferase [Paraurantiacibacter namhicola]|uniref:Phosphatidate cytidylyltransferase n=1 Tax=Paraurantiacibacter namhicola TaxID=645517 RepID=A0A1C7D9Y4_9SPHN|nr:phosphatidate cytidylyltransferase [Paraurantiacibacter namhicola]ANU08258.1 Phosphatidate cytidylyltransferase [Paraurantiacibacter namhicola]